jgi:uncharacterized membrane protein YcaP (DUF421 family)
MGRPFGVGQKVKLPQTIIIDGNFIEEAIYEMGYSVEWLKTQLQQRESTVKEVFWSGRSFR